MKKILSVIAIILLIFQMVVLAIAIDIGGTAIDRATAKSLYTLINKSNTANATGKITSIEIWAYTTIENCEVATFFVVSGDNFSTRDTHTIGTVTAGSKQTFEVSLNVQEGDYIGIYGSAGSVEAHTSGYDGVWEKSGDNIPCTNQLFTMAWGDEISLYGTGTTEEEEENAILFGINL